MGNNTIYSIQKICHWILDHLTLALSVSERFKRFSPSRRTAPMAGSGSSGVSYVVASTVPGMRGVATSSSSSPERLSDEKLVSPTDVGLAMGEGTPSPPQMGGRTPGDSTPVVKVTITIKDGKRIPQHLLKTISKITQCSSTNQVNIFIIYVYP